jgi:pSer/pThr/pTyr-binding forkhead associated (FHA) protein
MADSPSTKPAPPAPASKRPTLLPQANHVGKPAMPLGAHLFTLIGSRNRAHLHLLSSTISRNHACIITGRTGVYVRDLASRNGVIVNGQKVRESELQDGDSIQVGSFQFKFQEPPGPIRLATAPPAPLAMLEMDGGALTPMDGRTILIGRRPGCDITLDSTAVSNTHAVVFECDGKRYVRDLGSRTGTHVNGKAVHQQALEIGDQIKIGSTTLRYIAADMPGVEAGGFAEEIPLDIDLEPASAHEQPLEPVDLHLGQSPSVESNEMPAAVAAHDEPIPLEPPEAEHIEPAHMEPAPQLPEAIVPLDLEPDHPIETADRGQIEEPSLDIWTPEPEQSATAQSPELVNPEITVAQPLPAEPESPAIEDLSILPSDDLSAHIPALHSDEEFVPTLQSDETPAAVEEFVLPGEQTPDEENDWQSSAPIAEETTQSESSAFESLMAEPEASPLELPAATVEPDLAEPSAPAGSEQSVESHGDLTAPDVLEIPATVDFAEPAAEALIEEAPAAAESEPETAIQSEADLAAAVDAPPSEIASEAPATPSTEATDVATQEQPIESDLEVAPVAAPESEPAIESPPAQEEPEAAELNGLPSTTPLSATSHADSETALEVQRDDALSAEMVQPAADQDVAATTNDLAPETITPVEDRPARPSRKRTRTTRARRKRGELSANDIPTLADPDPVAVPLDSAAGEAEPVQAPLVEISAVEAAPIEAATVVEMPAEIVPTEAADRPGNEPETLEPQVAAEAPTPVDAPVIQSVENGPAEQPASAEAQPIAIEPETSEPQSANDSATAEALDASDEFVPAEPDAPISEPPPETPEAIQAAELTTHVDFVAPPAEAAVSATEPSAETIEGTEPTPESALDLEPSLPNLEAGPGSLEPANDPASSLTDSAFGQVVTEFASDQTGPLIEETNSAAAPASVEPTVESPVQDSHVLTPLGGADLPPLELGDALTFGSTAIEAFAAEQSVTADELVLERPVVADAAMAPASDLDFTAPAPVESSLDLELPSDLAGDLAGPNLEEPLGDDLPPFEEPSFDAGLDWDEPAAPAPLEEESGLEFDEPLTSIVPTVPPDATFDAAPPSARSEAPAPGRPTFAPPINPFFGMERDLGRFIGGMPLPLTAPPPQTQRPAAMADDAFPLPSTPRAASSEAAPLRALNLDSANLVEHSTTGSAPTTKDDELDLDKLFEGEEPLELFDETADQLDKLPDSFDPISDLGSTIGEPAGGPVVPAPSRTAPAPSLRSLTADASTAAAASPVTSSIPPFSGAAGRAARPGANPFAGLSELRPTDVFSQTAFPPMDESAFKPQPIDIPPLDFSNALPTGLGGSLPGSNAGLPPHKSNADAIAATPPPPRPIAPKPTAAMLAQGPADRRPWWKNIRILLPLLVLLIIAAVVVIIRFFPPKAIVQGTLQIKGIDDRELGVYARREQIDHVRLSVKDPDLREAVLQRLQSQGIPRGFVEDQDALNQLADPANSPFEDNRLVFRRQQDDAQDAQRMQAVLQTIYLVHKTAAEQTGRVQQQAAVAAKNASALDDRMKAKQEELKKISDQLKTTGAPDNDLLLDPAGTLLNLEQQNAELHKALATANDAVKRAHDHWQSALEATPGGANTDPKVQQIRQNLSSLESRLTVARLSGGPAVDSAKAFDDAVADIERDLTLIAAGNSKDPTLTTYLAAARKAAAEIHARVEAVKRNDACIEELRQQLAAHRAAHLRQVWTSDETLKGLLAHPDPQAQETGAASDIAAAPDAPRVGGSLEELDQKIEARRQSLATDADPLQQDLEQAIQHQQDERHESQARIAAALARLDIPPVGKVQLADERMLNDIGQEVAAAKAAYDSYAGGTRAPAWGNEAQVQKLQAEVAEQQAQLDGYEQRSDAKPAVAAARQALDAAQDAEAKAQAAYASSLNQFAVARRYRDEQMQVSDLASARNTAERDAQAMAAEAVATPVLLPPDPGSAVQTLSDADHRVWYLAAAIGLIVLLFAAPLWMAVRSPDLDIPYATARHRPAVIEEDAGDGRFPALDDDEHPALT